jgi:hypothetical protein
MSEIIIRPAETDNDVIAIHGFLCVVAGPNLPGPIDPHNSINEIWRVVNDECALVATREEDGVEKIVGTIGLVKVWFWWGDGTIQFLANRWFFALPGTPAGAKLREEAEAIAKELGLECHIYDEAKGRLVILNKSPLRSQTNPFLARPPVEPTHPAHTTQQ